MGSMMNKKVLYDIGLSQREVEVYLALLKVGITTTGPLVKESGIQNAKIYETLEKLLKKGIVSYVVKGKTKYFQPEEPKTLLRLFEEKCVHLKDVVSELELLRERQGSECTSKTYEGIKAIKSVFYYLYDYIGKGQEYLVFPLGEQLGTPELIQFWAQVLRKKNEMGIVVRTLPHKRMKPIFKKHYQQYKKVKIRYTTQSFPTGIFIFKDHVLSVLWGEKPVAFLVHSEENYLRWKHFFEEQWVKGKP